MPKQLDSNVPLRTEKELNVKQSKNRSISKRKPFIMQRIRRQDLILLTGVLSLACFSVVTVSLLILSQQPTGAGVMEPSSTPGPQPTHTVTYVQITGLSQYRLAEAKARAWAADAQLVSSQANWPRIITQDQIGEPGQWTYRFYSPARQRLFIIKVEADGQIHAFEHVVQITLPPVLLDTDVWSIDSPAALAIWLDYGGAELVRRNPGLEVLIQLRSLTNYPRPVWAVIGTDKRTQDLHIIVIDANEGRVVSTVDGLTP
jgi:hypothetical protein